MPKPSSVPLEKYMSVLTESNRARLRLRTLEWLNKKYADTESALMKWEDELWEHIKYDQGLLRPEDVILKVRLIYEAMAVPT